MTSALAVLLHALVMGAVPWGAGAGSQGGVRPLQVRQIVLPPPPTALASPGAAPAPAPPPSPPPAAAPVPRVPAATPSPLAATTPATAVESAPRPAEPEQAPPPEAVASAPAARDNPVADAGVTGASDASALPLPDTSPVEAGAAVAVASSGVGSAAEVPALDMAGGAPLPVYATRPAPPVTLRYELRRGGLRGAGEMSWRPRADGYSLAMRGTAFSLNIIEWTSEGGFDSAGLAPVRFVDRRRARDSRAANFQREAGRISFSGPATVYPLVPGAQDRVSWMLQLPAIVDAAPAVFVPGERIGLFVVGARGDADVWTFTVEGTEALDLPAGRVEGALRLRREPRKPYDTRVEVWLDPARHHLPVRLRLSSAEAGDGNEFLLESMTLPP